MISNNADLISLVFLYKKETVASTVAESSRHKAPGILSARDWKFGPGRMLVLAG